jgi:hypothetical protein
MAVLVFFGWLAFCGVVSWLTAFQMPDGYGTALFALQIIGAIISSGCMAQGLPTAIDPSTKVVVTNRLGNNFETTWPREKGMKIAIAGGVIFLVTNVGGWFLDTGMGLPERYMTKVHDKVVDWTREPPRPELDACLTTVWTPGVETCEVRYRVTTSGGRARVDLRKATCPHAPLATCIEKQLAGGEIDVDKRQLDTLAFTGPLDVAVKVSLTGTGPPPPAERPQ